MLLQNPVRVELSCPRGWTVGAAGILLGLAVVAAGVGPAQADPPNQKEVLEQLERIQEMVNKLRTQIADQPKADPNAKARLEVELLLKGEDPKNALDQRRAVLVLQQALANQAEAQQQAAQAEHAAATRALARVAQAQGEKAKMHEDHLKHIIDLLRKHQADLKDEQARKQFQEAIDRLTDLMKKKGVPAAPPTPPRAGVVAVPKPPVPADVVWQYAPHSAARDWTVKVWDAAGSPGRLGVRIEAPSAILAEQLNLPKDQGLVVTEVFENSIAKKAGIKANDILLKINQQTVSNSAEALKPLIDGFKADTAFDIVVLRRGKQETIKDVKLPEPVARVRTYPYFLDPTGQRAHIAITVTRTGDKMTLQRSEGSVVIVVNAETTGGKHQVTSISISEKGKEAKYQKLDEVPEAHRAKVQHMLQLLDAPMRTPQGQGADKGPGSTVDLYYVVPKVDGQQQFFYTPRTIVAPAQGPKFDVLVPAPLPSEDLQRRLLNFDVQIQRSGKDTPVETKP